MPDTTSAAAGCADGASPVPHLPPLDLPPLSPGTGDCPSPARSRSRRSSRSSSSVLTPGAELPLPPLAAVGAALAITTAQVHVFPTATSSSSSATTSTNKEYREYRGGEYMEFMDNLAFSPFPDLPPVITLQPMPAHQSRPSMMYRNGSFTHPSPKGAGTTLPLSASTTLPDPPRKAQRPLNISLPPRPSILADGDEPTPPLRSTPTAELGPFEYPIPEPGTAAGRRAASRPVPDTPRASKPQVAMSASFPPPGRKLRRRGSIASGQISRLAAMIDNWDTPSRTSSSTSLSPRAHLSNPLPSPPITIDAVKANASTLVFRHMMPPTTTTSPTTTTTTGTTTSTTTTTTPTTTSTTTITTTTTTTTTSATTSCVRPRLTHARTRSSGPFKPATPPSRTAPILVPNAGASAGNPHPTTVRLVPAQPRRGGLIAFSHSPLPAPIPPSLLARRGSVPVNFHRSRSQGPPSPQERQVPPDDKAAKGRLPVAVPGRVEEDEAGDEAEEEVPLSISMSPPRASFVGVRQGPASTTTDRPQRPPPPSTARLDAHPGSVR